MNILNHPPVIVGIDHGYGNIKTANCCFKTGVASFDNTNQQLKSKENKKK